MRALLLVVALLSQPIRADASTLSSLTERLGNAQLNASIMFERLQAAERAVSLKEKELEDAVRVLEEKNDTWTLLHNKAEKLRKPWSDAEGVIKEDQRLAEALSIASRAHTQAKKDFEAANQVLINIREESSANLMRWKIELDKIPSKSELAKNVSDLTRNVNDKQSALSKLEKKYTQRKSEVASRITKLALQELEKSINTAKNEMKAAEEELRLAQEKLDKHDSTAQHLRNQIRAAEERLRGAEAVLEERIHHVEDASKAEASAARDLQQHAAAKREADAQLAKPQAYAVTAAVNDAENADWAKLGAAAGKKHIEGELEAQRMELEAARKVHDEARSFADGLKKEIQEKENEGISVGSIGGVVACSTLVVGLIAGSIVVFIYRDQICKRGRKRGNEKKNAKSENFEMQENEALIPFQHPKTILPETDTTGIATDSGIDSILTDATHVPRSIGSSFHTQTTEKIVEDYAEPVASSPRSPTGSKFESDYVVKKILGVGGFGCVFEAHDKNVDLDYAVKRIAVPASEKDKTLSEARILVRLEHPGIVRCFHAWVEEPQAGAQHILDGALLSRIVTGLDNQAKHRFMSYHPESVFIYIKTELCQTSLSEWLKEHQDWKSREMSRMKNWYKQIVSAVEYIHKKGYIHRDLKPSNILISGTDTMKVCDLGIATERRRPEDENSALERTCSVGTQLYMSPEQRNFPYVYNASTDVFTLGLILMEMCVPMTPKQRLEIFEQTRDGRQFELFNDEKDRNIRRFISEITQKKPEQRISCKEMLEHPFLIDLVVNS